MRTLYGTGLLLLLLAVSACGPDAEPVGDLTDLAIPPERRNTLRIPESVTLYTIASKNELEESSLWTEKIGGYVILDEVELDPATDGRLLIDSFLEAVQHGIEDGTACFNPHHALRIDGPGGEIRTIICFECHNYRVEPAGGDNNVVMSTETGMEDTWRSVVRKHKLRDISDK
jgi:hypothetical protein